MQHETVTLNSPETVCLAVGDMKIRGTGGVFYNPLVKGTQFEVAPGVMMRVAPGAWDRVMASDTRILFNHDANHLLGRTPGTAKVFSTPHGFDYEVDLPPTSLGRDIFTLVQRGDLTGSSMTATIAFKQWGQEGDLRILNLIRFADLLDTGPVTYPAMTAATVGLSSDRAERLLAEFNHWQRTERTKQIIEARQHR